MPLMKCTVNGAPGWKFGSTGKCYTYDPATQNDGEMLAKKKAIKQANAIGEAHKLTDRDFAEAGIEDRQAFADALETVDLMGVPLMASGGPYFGNGSPAEGDHFDDAHLRTIADQTRACADEVRIPIKIGHNRSQKLLKNSGLFTDEMPAAGWVNATNMRVASGQLLGDLMRVPKKLAQLITSGAFRTRSVELSRVKAQKQGGKEYDSVITGLALLGAKAPAIRTLDDIIALYADVNDDAAPTITEGAEVTPVAYFSTTLQIVDRPADTSTMDPVESKTEATPPVLTDEQIVALAATFGITEEDSAKRRDAVLAKFSELAPKKDETSTPPDPTPPAPDPTPPAPTASTEPATTSLSEAEVKKLREDAEMGRKAYTDNRDLRIAATVRAASKQGRIKVADEPQWRQFMERDEEFAITQLLALPVNPDATATYGADDDVTDDARAKQGEDMYAMYAAQTGVPARIKTIAGGNA